MESKSYEDSEVLCSENLIFPSMKLSTVSGGLLLKAYSFRYWMIRSLTCKVPFLPDWITQGRTLIELIMIELTFNICIIIIQKYDSISSGQLTANIACLMILFGLRNNILTILFGISFERALQYHKAFARLALLLGFFHAYTNFKSDTQETFQSNMATGISMWSLLFAASIAYLIKEYFFEFFYFFHIICYVTVVILGYFHGATVMSLSIIVWGIDVLTRYYFSAHKTEGKIKLMEDDNIIEISFLKTFSYSSGQYCFISIPALSYYQFHPFCISSSPHEPYVTLHVRAVGKWTKDLKKLANTHNQKTTQTRLGWSRGGIDSENRRASSTIQGDQTSLPLPLPVIINVEGPYGLPCIDLSSGYYQVYLLIAGGIGITSIQSMYNHLVRKYGANSQFLKRCILIWTVKDLSLISSFSESLQLITDDDEKKNLSQSHSKYDNNEEKMIDDVFEAPLSSIDSEIENGDENENENKVTTVRKSKVRTSNDSVNIENSDKYKSNNDRTESGNGNSNSNGNNNSNIVMKNRENNGNGTGEDSAIFTVTNPLLIDREAIMNNVNNNNNHNNSNSNNNISNDIGIEEENNSVKLGKSPFCNVFHVTSSDTNSISNVQQRNAEEGNNKNKKYSLLCGRPVYEKWFTEISTVCVLEGISRVAVVTCGPSSMIKDVATLCSKRHRGIAFDVHKEVFDF